MDHKLLVANKLLTISKKKRDQQGMILEQLSRQAEHYQQQLNALGQLKTGCRQFMNSSNSVALQNTVNVQSVLTKMLSHHQHEKALLDAECQYSKKQLESSHAKVKGLESVVERWEKKQQYEQAKQDQKRVEDIINSRYKKPSVFS